MGRKTWEDVIIVDGNDIPGKRIIETIKKIKIKHDASLGFKKHSKWAFNAQNELKKIASKLGANAIIEAQFAFIGEFQQYSGKAVIIEDID